MCVHATAHITAEAASEKNKNKKKKNEEMHDNMNNICDVKINYNCIHVPPNTRVYMLMYK